MKKNGFAQFTLHYILPIGIPFVVFIIHSFFFSKYIIDDAGISYAYARNLASGFGLVSQPGMPPVEGYSNFTWVMLLAPFFMLHAFDPILTPKIIGSVLVLLTFIVIRQILSRTTTRPALGTFIVLLFLSVNTSFVLWATAGLENPLYIFFVILLVYVTILNNLQQQTKWIILLGILAALCALTRPDGVLFSLLYPAFTVLAWLFAKEKPAIKSILKSFALYAGVFLMIYGGYVVFRYFYFHDIYPNTYWAKGGQLSMQPKDWYVKIRDLLKSFGLTRYTLVIFVGMVLYALVTRSVKKAAEWIVLLAFSISFAIFTLMPSDWMPEFRFATPFIMLFFLSAYLILSRFAEKLIPNSKAAGWVILLIFALWSVKNMPDYYERSMLQVESPMVPFTDIAEDYAFRFNHYAEALHIKNASLLIPDLGGTLYYSDLRIYDLAGLTDKTIARTLRDDKKAFYDYVFDTLKPTFIHTHKVWAYLSDFDNDPRFREDYVPIRESYDEWIQTGYREDKYSGDYIRKDAITDPAILQELQHEAAEEFDRIGIRN